MHLHSNRIRMVFLSIPSAAGSIRIWCYEYRFIFGSSPFGMSVFFFFCTNTVRHERKAIPKQKNKNDRNRLEQGPAALRTTGDLNITERRRTKEQAVYVGFTKGLTIYRLTLLAMFGSDGGGK